MKIIISTDEGVILDIIENVEQYDLNKPMARSELVDEIQHALRIGEKME